MTVDGFTLDAPRAGTYEVAINPNRWWGVADGDACVRDVGGRTVVDATAAGPIAVEPGLSRGRC